MENGMRAARAAWETVSRRSRTCARRRCRCRDMGLPSCECPWASSYNLYGLTASSAWQWASFCKRCRILCKACRSCTSRDFRSTRRQDRQTLPHGILWDFLRTFPLWWRTVFHLRRAGCPRSSGISFVFFRVARILIV